MHVYTSSIRHDILGCVRAKRVLFLLGILGPPSEPAVEPTWACQASVGVLCWATGRQRRFVDHNWNERNFQVDDDDDDDDDYADDDDNDDHDDDDDE